MTTSAKIHAALSEQNVLAFLRVIRQGESGQEDSAYYMVNGMAPLANLHLHPYDGIPTTQGAKAAGAYQFLGTTWRSLVNQYPDDIKDFSPAAQDFAAVADIAGRGALDDIVVGRFEAALTKLRPEWTSLPGASESNPAWTVDAAKALYSQYGGLFEPQPVAEPVAPQPTVAKGNAMDPLTIIGIVGPILQALIPQVGTLFGGKKDAANAQLAGAVLNAVSQAAGTIEAGQTATLASTATAVEKMQADPALVTTVQQAVVTHPDVMSMLGIVEVGGGIAAARQADVAASQAEKPFWYGPVSWATVLLLPLIYYTVIMVLGGGAQVTQETKSMVIGFIIGTTLGSIISYYYGTTSQSAKKDETIAATTK